MRLNPNKIVMSCVKLKKELIRQIEELNMESQSFEHIFIDDAYVEKVH